MKRIISFVLVAIMLFCTTVAFADEQTVIIDTEVPEFKELLDGSVYRTSGNSYDKEIYIADLTPVDYIVLKKKPGSNASFTVSVKVTETDPDTGEIKTVDKTLTKTFKDYEETSIKGHNLKCINYVKVGKVSELGSYMVYAVDEYNHDIAVRFKLEKTTNTNIGGGGGGGGNGELLVSKPYANGNPNNTSGTLIAGEKITLDSDTGNATIYYTTDGTTPTAKSTKYNEKDGIVLKVGQTLKAVAIKSGKSSKISTWEAVAPETPEDPGQSGSQTGTGSIVKDVLETENHIVYMNGYPDETFGPNNNMTRAEVATMFARLMKNKMEDGKTYESKFSDVAPDTWYANYIGYIEDYGIITGYEDGTFRPQNTITRAEFVAMASRFTKMGGSFESTFTDVSKSHWAYDYIVFASGNKWINGYEDNTFRADNTITRAEVVTIVNNMLDRSADKEYVNDNKGSLILFNDTNEDHWAYYDIIEATNEHKYKIINSAEKWN